MTVDTAPPQGPRSDPTGLLHLVEGMYAIEMLITAVGSLSLFDRLAEQPRDARTLARDLGITERPADVLFTLCRNLGLIDVDEQGVLTATELATEFMTSSSPWTMVPCYAALKERPVCKDLLNVLRTGRAAIPGPPPAFGDGPPELAGPPQLTGDGPPMMAGGPPGMTGGGPPGEDGPPDWLTGMGDVDFAEMFLRATDSRSTYLAHEFAKVLDIDPNARLLDVAGGSGLFSSAVARRHPGLQATVLEKPPVDTLAKRAVTERGLADRVNVVSGDMFNDPLPTDHNAHLFSNVIHDWEKDEIRQLLAASYRALPPGGTIYVHDAFLDAAKDGPASVAQYSVLLLFFTDGRCYSTAEIGDLMAEVGFVDTRFLPTLAGRGVLAARRPN